MLVIDENILFSKMILQPSRTNSFEKRFLISSGCLSEDSSTAVPYRSRCMIEYKFKGPFVFICYYCSWCGGPKKSLRTSSIVQMIFSCPLRSARVILRNQKFIIGLDSFSNQRFISLALFG